MSDNMTEAEFDAAFAEWFPSHSRDVMAMISGRRIAHLTSPEFTGSNQCS